MFVGTAGLGMGAEELVRVSLKVLFEGVAGWWGWDVTMTSFYEAQGFA